MKRIVLLMMICCFSVGVFAQKNTPKWMDKARKAVVKITTYDKDNRQLAEGYGFFVSEIGDVLSGYSIFKDASRAVVTDFEGKEYTVSHVIGADDLYEVIKVRVPVVKKPLFLAVTTRPVQEGETVYQVRYSPEKEMNFKQGKVTEVSTFKEIYGYYQIGFPLEPGLTNTPLLNEQGEVLGLAQEDASGKNETFYAISAAYVNELVQTSTDIFNPTYRNIKIRKAWAPNVQDASVSLFLFSNQQEPAVYLETINDFIATFPNASEGYQNRARFYVYKRKELSDSPAEQQKYLELAKADYNTAIKFASNKDEVWYEYGKTIYGAVVEDPELNSADWSLDKAMEMIDKAIAINDLPVYQQMKGDIYMYKGDFEKAYNTYMVVNNSDLATANTYYWAAKALENVSGFNIGDVLDLLDKAVEISGTGPEAGPFVLERIDKRLMLSQYEEAIADYDHYYFVMNGNVNDTFYYLREQAKFRKGDLQGALEDINEALKIDPENPDYYAEEASVYIRLQEYQKALDSADEALALAPDFGACYRLKGVCYLRLDRKQEACDALHKAQELGDPVAEKLISENCQ